MERTRKILHEANRGQESVASANIARGTFPEEGSVEKSLRYQARREAFIDADATRTPRPSGFDPA